MELLEELEELDDELLLEGSDDEVLPEDSDELLEEEVESLPVSLPSGVDGYCWLAGSGWWGEFPDAG